MQTQKCQSTVPALLRRFTQGCMRNAGGLLETVREQLQTDTILGWFAYRCSSSLQPTAQEEMLSRSMAARTSLWDQQQSNVLFALVSLQQRHDGSSCEFQQRVFQLNSNRYCSH